jgi:ribosomal RNA methyltransferase Nop2
VFLAKESFVSSDDLLKGVPEELDLGSDDEEVELLPQKGRKSKQAERPTKIIPTASDEDSDDESDDEDGPITAKNIESRSRALDEKAAREAELDIEEMQNAVFEGSDEDIDMEGEGEDAEAFHLPTAEERAEEKNHVADVHVVQRRMRECVRILGNFRKLGAKGRYVFPLAVFNDVCILNDIQATVRICRAARF